MGNIALIISIIFISIMLHELGHLHAARFFGVSVDAYSIGFGPKLCSWKRGGTEWCLRVLPFGGSCSINEAAFRKVPAVKQILIFLAGPAVNLVLSVAAISIVLMMEGVFSVQEVFGTYRNAVSFLSAGFLSGLVETATASEPVIAESFSQMGGALQSTGTLAEYLKVAIAFGFSLNLILAFTNLLPVPGLDGGQILLTIPAVFGRPLNEKAVAVVNAVCVTAIMSFMGFVYAKDIVLSFL